MSHNSDVRRQSEAAYRQWAPQWRKQAEHHSRYKMKDIVAFQNVGVGKACLVIANGYSFEKNIETIKKHQDNVDILCVDKCLAACLNAGIVPTYALVCDANVSYEKYLKPVEDKLEKTILFINVCANPKWTDNGNWKDRYFFVNKDVLDSDKEFSQLSGCRNLIAAATNVSNAAVVLLTQCENGARRNFFGYDKILLIGYDYCWDDRSYYAFDKQGGGKSNYMKQVYVFNLASQLAYTSPNLLFSSKWLERYIKMFNVPAIQCTRETILTAKAFGDLAEQMSYRYKAEDAAEVISVLEYRRKLQAKIDAINQRIFDIGRDHYQQLIRTT